MADLIDRDALMKDMKSDCPESDVCIAEISCIECIIGRQPAVNRWISVEDALPEQSEEGQPPNVKCSDCVIVAAVDWIGMAYYVTYGKESQCGCECRSGKERYDDGQKVDDQAV